ncbi:DUF6541 family protein [Agromyces soli]|uniref:Uncharacterized protein n=1 Tax=Agromyces soli TaxID=659012 RepID=A0ABY4AV55_9MICO|nr:DUF6541 family protein [Agromyces soli]UOE26041.1 hypothetical protein MTP13_17290 [Agromyces soli]
MSWLEAIPPGLIAIGLLLVPGAPFALALGLRGIGFLAVSAGASVSVIAGASIVAPMLGLDWSLVPVGLAAVAAGLVGLAFRPLARRGRGAPESWRTLWPALAGIAAAAALILLFVLPAIGSPGHPSQTYDALYHLNAIRWIADTGDASPLRMQMTTPGSSSFYPTTWHGIAVLVLQLSGADPVVVANVLALVVAAVLWPLGTTFLVRAVLGARPLTLVLGGALAAGFAMFPILLVQYGVLYPNALAIALVPIALGALVAMLRGGARTGAAGPGGLGLSPLGWLPAAVAAVGAATIAHPNALFSLFVLSAPLVIATAVRGVRAQSTAWRRALVIVAVLVLFCLEAVVWLRFGTTDNGWPPARPFYASVGEALLNSPLDITVGYTVTIMVILGFVAAVVRRVPVWLLGSYLACVVLFAVANGWPAGGLRTLLTGLWYNDAFRLAALLPIAAVPLAVAGLVLALDWIGRAIDRAGERSAGTLPAGLRTGVIGLLAAVAVVSTQFGAIPSLRADLEAAYRVDADSPSVNADELALFEDVRELVPAGAVIAGNPWNGSTLVYAFTGRQSLFPHVGGRYPASYWAVANGLADATPDACAAAAELGVTHVIDSDDRMLFPGDPRAELYPGLTGLSDDPPGLTLIAQRGDARLYEVTGC